MIPSADPCDTVCVVDFHLRWTAIWASLISSLIVRGKVTRRCPQTTTFEEKGEPKRGLEQTSSDYRPTTQPLGQAGSMPCTPSAYRPTAGPSAWPLGQAGSMPCTPPAYQSSAWPLGQAGWRAHESPQDELKGRAFDSSGPVLDKSVSHLRALSPIRFALFWSPSLGIPSSGEP